MPDLEVSAPDDIGEVGPGADLAALAAPHVREGDVLVVTSKIVSKAEGRVVAGTARGPSRTRPSGWSRAAARPASSRTRLGVVLAAAGVDASNVAAGSVVLLPVDPDASARRLREMLAETTGVNVAVVVSDTAGRAWRHGQTDLALGVAGIEPLESFAGATDSYGNPLAVTAPAVADEIAGIAEVASGKLGGRPLTVVRGLADRVLPPGEHGPGARVLVRETGTDMFGLGSREAVVAALSGRDQDAFGSPADADDLVRALVDCGLTASASEAGVVVTVGPDDPRLAVVAFAFGWTADRALSTDSTTVVAPLS